MRHDPATLRPLLERTLAAAQEFLLGLDTHPAARPDVVLPTQPLPAGLGETGALEAFRRRWEGALSGSAGPRYLGFVTGGTTPAALAGDWLTAAYDQNVSNDVGSAASQVERETIAWLRTLFGLPETFHGVFVSGATASNTAALATARQWAYSQRGIDAAQDGLAGAPPLRVLAGAAHSSVTKALAILGLGRSALRPVATLPGRTAVDVVALEAALRDLGGAPAIVVASAGEVNTGDFDDIAAIAALRTRYGAWLHVDGAFGLFAALSPRHAHLLHGVDAADSVACDLHKWMNVPYDAAVVFTRHPELQRAVYRASSAYLGDSTDPLHYTPENSRRFRALPAWMSLAAYGRDGIGAWVQRNCAQADALAAGLAAAGTYEVLDAVRLNIVCFALRSGDAAARDRVLARVQADGRTFLTPTVLFGRPAIRAAFSNWSTQESDVEHVLAALAAAAA